MTSADLAFCDDLGSKMEEKAAAVDSEGTGAVMDIGLCMEKKEETRISASCKCPVEGTLGRFIHDILGIPLPTVSGIPSFDFRLFVFVPERPSLAAGLAFLAGGSDGVAMARGSSLDEFGVFEEECFR